MAAILEGIKVVDLTRVFAGPASTQVLGDLGADIIKIEGLSGDSARTMGSTAERLQSLGGVSPSFLAMNRNKRSITLDLHLQSARDAALRLASSADVMVHNFRPGVVERWGLDYTKVSTANPRIIYAEFSAFGATGPMAHVGANDAAMQAYSGLLSATGHRGQPPVRCGTAVVDMHGSLALASGILAALYHRERTGEGQLVQTSLLQSAAHLMSYVYADYWADGTVAEPLGTANTLSVPNQAFPTADGSVVIIAYADAMWERCANALDAEQLNTPDFKCNFDRLRHRDRLVGLLSDITSKMTSKELVEKLEAVRVNVARVNTVAQAADSEQLAAVGGWFDLGDGSRLPRTVATPFKLEKTPGELRRPPPQLGTHAEEILQEAGFTKTEVAALRADGALG